MAKKQGDEEPVTQAQFGTFIEHMNDQFARVLEAVEFSTSKIPTMAERLERVEHDLTMVRLNTGSTGHDLETIKIRTEKLEDLAEQAKDHELRITKLEHKAA